MVLYILFVSVRYSCPLSAGVLHVLLCLKVYSWCVCGKRCTPYPLTPLPSCSHVYSQFLRNHHYSPQWLYQFNHSSHWLPCPPLTLSVSALTLQGPGRGDWEDYRRPERERDFPGGKVVKNSPSITEHQAELPVSSRRFPRAIYLHMVLYIYQSYSLNLPHSHELEGWDGGGVVRRLKRERIYAYLQLIHIVVQQKLAQHCKAFILQFKKIEYT